MTGELSSPCHSFVYPWKMVSENLARKSKFLLHRKILIKFFDILVFYVISLRCLVDARDTRIPNRLA